MGAGAVVAAALVLIVAAAVGTAATGADPHRVVLWAALIALVVLFVLMPWWLATAHPCPGCRVRP